MILNDFWLQNVPAKIGIVDPTRPQGHIQPHYFQQAAGEVQECVWVDKRHRQEGLKPLICKWTHSIYQEPFSSQKGQKYFLSEDVFAVHDMLADINLCHVLKI